VGFDLTYWPENQNQAFRSATIPVHDVHDRCLGLPEDEEYEINSRLNGYLVESSKGRVELSRWTTSRSLWNWSPT
jgi:hypothetical protein